MSKELRELYDKLRNAQDKSKEIIAKEDATEEEIQAAMKDIRVIQAKIEAQKELEKPNEVEEEDEIADEGTKLTPNYPVSNSIQKTKLDDGGFANVGEFLNCIKNGDKKGRIKNLASSDAGILIPPQFSQNIMQLNGEDEIIMPRATNIPAGDPPDAPFTIPYLQQGSDGVLGGIELDWTNEEKEVSDTKDPVVKDLTLTPQEVSGMATVNNKTLNNWQASGDFIQMLLRQAWVNGRDAKFFNGSGVGCPLGIFNSDGIIEITRKTEDTFTYMDAVTMLSRLLPQALDGAMWTISVTLMVDVMTMKDDSGRLIFSLGDATKGVPPTLLGLPIKWTGKTKTKGTRGDVLLSNFSYYLTKQGSGPFIDISKEFKFDKKQTVFRIVANIDGQGWVKDPLKLEDGQTTVSPYVVLK